MKSPVVALSCLVLCVAVIEAGRLRRAATPELNVTASPAAVVDGRSELLSVECRVSNGPDDVTPVYVLLQRSNEKGIFNLALQMAKRTDLLAEEDRTSAEGAIANGDDEETYLTFNVTEPTFAEEGEYVCQYLYLSPEVNTVTASVTVSVESLPAGETYVPPPPKVEEGSCCEDIMAEIEKLKASGPVQAAPGDGQCQAAFSAGLRQVRGYMLISNRPIRFDTILTNSGSAYDVETGAFTAPCTGQYFFSLTLTALHSSSGTVEGVIRRAGKNQARSFSFTSLGYNEIHSASTSVLLTLERGEQVDVLLEASSDGEYVGGDSTIFAGYYLYP